MRGKVIAKLVLDGGTYTYSTSSTNQLWRIVHPETPWSQTAKVLIDNSNKVLAGLSLEGLSGVISYGYNTSAGDEYSATAPLRVKGQELISSGGTLQCLLDLYGIPDQLDDDHASASFSMESSDTRTVKTLISAILGATLAPYSHCAAITVTYDSEDSLIDTFKPADYFRISVGKTRLSCLKELLSYTKCVMRAEDDGEVHILSPIVSGATYAYEYNDTILSTNHTFFSKVYRTRLVLPNKITVKSDDDHAPGYTGNASDSASYALLPKEAFYTMRLTSNAQATAIAEAKIQKLQVDHEKGNGFAPMNVGQEVYDYDKITDSREGNNRIGNIGYLTRTFDINNRNYPWTIGFGFGDIYLAGAAGLITPSGTGSTTTTTPRYATYADLMEIYSILNGNIEQLYDYLNKAVVPKWHVTRDMGIPLLD